MELAVISIGDPWSGVYFQGVPIRLTATPSAGFTFVGWSDPDVPQEPTVEVRPEKDYALVSFFQNEEIGLISHSARPNPFSSSVSVWFELAEDSKVEFVVSDVCGRRVRGYVPKTLRAGYRAITWDGCDDTGHPVPAGVYFYELLHGGTRGMGRVVAVR